MGGVQVWTSAPAVSHTELEYLDLKGTGYYFTTDFIPDVNTSIEYVFAYPTSAPSRGSSQTKTITLWKSPDSKMTASFYATYTNNYCTYNFASFARSGYATAGKDTLSTNKKYTLKITPTEASFDGKTATLATGTASESTTALRINCADSSYHMRVYSFRIWDGDTLVREYIPVLKDDAAQMYDTVTGTYLTPSSKITSYA